MSSSIAPSTRPAPGKAIQRLQALQRQDKDLAFQATLTPRLPGAKPDMLESGAKGYYIRGAGDMSMKGAHTPHTFTDALTAAVLSLTLGRAPSGNTRCALVSDFLPGIGNQPDLMLYTFTEDPYANYRSLLADARELAPETPLPVFVNVVAGGERTDGHVPGTVFFFDDSEGKSPRIVEQLALTAGDVVDLGSILGDALPPRPEGAVHEPLGLPLSPQQPPQLAINPATGKRHEVPEINAELQERVAQATLETAARFRAKPDQPWGTVIFRDEMTVP